MDSGREEATIRGLYEQLMDGWNAGDAEAFAAPFEEDADFVAFDGTHFKGRSRPAPERDSVQTLVAVKRDGGWRLAAFHNTRVRPMGRNAGGTLIWLLSDRLWRLFRPRNPRAEG